MRRLEMCLHVDFVVVSRNLLEGTVRTLLGQVSLGHVLVQGLLIDHGRLTDRADLKDMISVQN